MMISIRAALKREVRAVLAAWGFFTRLPLPGVVLGASDMGVAVTYLPACGWLTGGWAALVYVLAACWWPPLVASVLSLGATLLLTGALHEDGWADVCDGFGGGATRERVLAIMQDSHIGVFGVAGLTVAFGLKVTLLPTLAGAGSGAVGEGGASWVFVAGVIAAHSLSRASAVALMAGLPYARAEGAASKSRALVCAPGPVRLAWVLALGLAPFVWLPGEAWLVVPVVASAHFACRAWLRHRLGGYTGDCLGACQQGTELLIYLGLSALL